VEELRRAIEDHLYELRGDLDLPMEAAYALVRGLDSPALAELAGLAADDSYQIRELIPAVIEELSIDMASLAEAVISRARETASSYLTGNLEFRPAAKRIVELLPYETYLTLEDFPEESVPALDDLWRLDEWLYATERGFHDDSRYFFSTREDAEAHFRNAARSLATLAPVSSPP
jgi:hypothetical protein